VRVVFSARRDVGLRACDLDLRGDFRREDVAVFDARGFCGGRRVARLLDFGLRLRGGIRLYLLRFTAMRYLWYNQGFQARRGRGHAKCVALDSVCLR